MTPAELRAILAHPEDPAPHRPGSPTEKFWAEVARLRVEQRLAGKSREPIKEQDR